MADHSTPEASASSLPATSSTLSDLYRAGNLDRFAARQGEPSKGGATSSQSDYGNEDDEDDEDSEYSYFNTSTGNGYQISDAQAEWEESLRQLEQLLTFILVPVIGKFFGRRFAYFGKSENVKCFTPLCINERRKKSQL